MKKLYDVLNTSDEVEITEIEHRKYTHKLSQINQTDISLKHWVNELRNQNVKHILIDENADILFNADPILGTSLN